MLMDDPPIRHQPRKRFGQNFLTDTARIERIAQLIAPRPDQHLVEIGPGLGALTVPLAASGARLTLVELDRDLVHHLQQQFGDLPRLQILSADALRTDFRALTAGAPIRVVGNLPYNISTPLLFHLFNQLDVIQDMHFMLQREVVERMTAKPGTADWGRLGIMCQYYCRAEKLMDVPPGAFNPPPRVQSAIVRLTPHTPDLQALDRLQLELVVRTAFGQRRKTLRNALKQLINESGLQQLGIDPSVRPEQLSLIDFVRIANQLESQ